MSARNTHESALYIIDLRDQVMTNENENDEKNKCNSKFTGCCINVFCMSERHFNRRSNK